MKIKISLFLLQKGFSCFACGFRNHRIRRIDRKGRLRRRTACGFRNHRIRRIHRKRRCAQDCQCGRKPQNTPNTRKKDCQRGGLHVDLETTKYSKYSKRALRRRTVCVGIRVHGAHGINGKRLRVIALCPFSPFVSYVSLCDFWKILSTCGVQDSCCAHPCALRQ